MSKDMRTRVVVAVVAIIVVIIVGSEYRKQREGTVRQIQGTVTAVDAAARQASIEFVHPKSGQLFQLTGNVPADCEIRIDGQPATLADLKVGDTVQVEGTLGRDKRVTAKAIRVTRATTTATAPAATTRPAGAP